MKVNQTSLNKNCAFGVKLTHLPKRLKKLMTQAEFEDIANISPKSLSVRFVEDGDRSYLLTKRPETYVYVKNNQLKGSFGQNLIAACKLLVQNRYPKVHELYKKQNTRRFVYFDI